MNAPRNEENEHPEGDRPDTPAEGTAPPSNPEVDEQAVEEGRDKLDQAGGGH